MCTNHLHPFRRSPQPRLHLCRKIPIVWYSQHFLKPRRFWLACLLGTQSTSWHCAQFRFGLRLSRHSTWIVGRQYLVRYPLPTRFYLFSAASESLHFSLSVCLLQASSWNIHPGIDGSRWTWSKQGLPLCWTSKPSSKWRLSPLKPWDGFQNHSLSFQWTSQSQPPSSWSPSSLCPAYPEFAF